MHLEKDRKGKKEGIVYCTEMKQVINRITDDRIDTIRK